MSAQSLAFLAIPFAFLALILLIAVVSRMNGFDDRLPPPDQSCERLASHYWRVGMAASGWRAPGKRLRA